MFQTFGVGGTIVDSDDLTMMHTVLREWCDGHGYPEKSPQATAAAKALIRWFQTGRTQRWQLHELLNSRQYS